MLPADWPAWQTVYYYLRTWRRDGTLQRIHTTLREEVRVALGRDPQPSAGSVDSQSVKTTSVGGERGYDGAKKLVGRKRHILVDTEGLLQAVNVHPANVMDRDGIQIDWSKYLPEPGFHLLPRRWVVERTFAWLLLTRRLSREYERLCATSETWIYLAMIRIMLRRLVHMP